MPACGFAGAVHEYRMRVAQCVASGADPKGDMTSWGREDHDEAGDRQHAGWLAAHVYLITESDGGPAFLQCRRRDDVRLASRAICAFRHRCRAYPRRTAESVVIPRGVQIPRRIPNGPARRRVLRGEGNYGGAYDACRSGADSSPTALIQPIGPAVAHRT